MPVGSYRNFADCVSKNQDKDSPESYCGSIKAKVEKKMNGQAILNGVSKLLVKQGPPGPPPRPGLQWDTQSHRWTKPSGSAGQAPTVKPQRFEHERNTLSAIGDLKEGGDISAVKDAVYQLYPTVEDPAGKQALKVAWSEMARDPHHPGRWEKLHGVVASIMNGPINRMSKGPSILKGVSAILNKLDK
ncbi:hypothetical protein LCGC14_0263980 [marine sediment metagenome]|uniref:Uncharacterized protein n=1 Tax=marine sediment metagenome TaxID=412755 RepID=A0A0F9U5H1_9ZZZZ